MKRGRAEDLDRVLASPTGQSLAERLKIIDTPKTRTKEIIDEHTGIPFYVQEEIKVNVTMPIDKQQNNSNNSNNSNNKKKMEKIHKTKVFI